MQTNNKYNFVDLTITIAYKLSRLQYLQKTYSQTDTKNANQKTT